MWTKHWEIVKLSLYTLQRWIEHLLFCLSKIPQFTELWSTNLPFCFSAIDQWNYFEFTQNLRVVIHFVLCDFNLHQVVWSIVRIINSWTGSVILNFVIFFPNLCNIWFIFYLLLNLTTTHNKITWFLFCNDHVISDHERSPHSPASLWTELANGRASRWLTTFLSNQI